MAVQGDAGPRVRRCRIHHTSGRGVFVYDNGAGLFENNEISGNRKADWNVSGADRTKMIRR
ncbi:MULTISPECIES: right-handed parallel beta-helix repeat-containing protein [Protofrankia]|uniref:right-handed parallel beta-helix repeat-containing protein n=1 Tax=Protofrankia TaxID=2994361 RepID=UPI0003170268|nr:MULTISPECIES: right-handed parallel beta-helix repeat-containing protein [Protofrankia]